MPGRMLGLVNQIFVLLDIILLFKTINGLAKSA